MDSRVKKRSSKIPNKNGSMHFLDNKNLYNQLLEREKTGI